MKASNTLRRSAVGVAVILALVTGAPVLAGEGVIRNGVDAWMTVAGFAQTSFESEPIPADFFCPGSQPFTGRIWFQGVPLATAPAGSLGKADTVVRRLDDAVFNERGEAYTRLQLMALSLVSTRPVETSCGSYDVAVRLDGEQPTTNMRIVRTSKFGGTYSAPLALDVRVVFTPLEGAKGVRRELTRRVDLGPAAGSFWSYTTKAWYEGTPRIDTDGDSAPDTALPAASNFVAGVEPVALAASSGALQPAVKACSGGYCPYQSCHCNPDSTDPYESSSGCSSSHLHCVTTCVLCMAY